MELEDLRSFAMVVRHGGFSAAERATGEARGKLSKRVAKLERELGTRLLERSTRNVRVTDVGQEVYRQCEVIADGLAATRAIAERAREDVSGLLRISCPPGLARYLGAEGLASFLARYPQVRLDMHLTSRRVDIIREGFDIALRVDVEEETDLSLTMRQLGRSQRILVASPEFLAGLPPIGIDMLQSLPTLTIGEHAEHHRWDMTSETGERARIFHRPRLCSNDSTIVREAALDGLGVALLHEQGCRADLLQGRLLRVLPQWHTREGIVHMVFAARRGMSAAQRAFIDHYAAQPFFPPLPDTPDCPSPRATNR
ncbi:MAG: LysR family transcriptional regulator [Novosphingobium sp.]|uniref:LysR substrate-binding domain-containing protein n=1 Tax=Novosphingobium sp. TaxID=1874826 RepID=UPI0012C9B351|nr:LysR substrate-binding domain-containing protein [Novosphingobium sp.]MPS70626.1 LysR family transcriptional regulator [Novosphingobium sp.]